MGVKHRPQSKFEIEDWVFLIFALIAIIVPGVQLISGLMSGHFNANPTFLLAMVVGGVGWLRTLIITVGGGAKPTHFEDEDYHCAGNIDIEKRPWRE